MFAQIENAKKIINAEIRTALDERETAWLEEPWPLFVGARRLRVVHLTLRRWRYMLGSGLLDEASARRRPDVWLYYLCPEFRYLDDRAFRRWRRSVATDLKQRGKIATALEQYIAFYFADRKERVDPAADFGGETKPPDFTPWDALNTPIDEVVYLHTFGAIYGGKDAVLDCPLPQLWQHGEYLEQKAKGPGSAVFRPGDRYRKHWDELLEQAVTGTED